MNSPVHQRGIIGWVLALMLAGLVLAMLTPFVMGQHKRSAEDTDRAALEAARTAVVAYAMTHGKLPTPVPDTNDPKRCPNGIMPADLGVNNWGRYGAANPFCLDTNVTLSGTSNPKALCAAARRELATASATLPLPRVFRDSAYTSSAPMAFVLYSTGNDRLANLENKETKLVSGIEVPLVLGDPGFRIYEHDFRGIDDSPGTNHYDDQVLSYPLASLLAECGKVGGQGGKPICNVAPPTTTIKLGSSAALTGSCSDAPNCTPPYAWASTPPASAPVPLGAASGNATPVAPGSYDYTLAGCNEFGTGPASTTKATVIVTAPVCTLTPSPATITTTGGSSTLTLSCDVAPTAYSWSGGYGTAGCNGATCVVTPPATQVFSVTPTFGTAPNTWTPSSAVTATVAFVPSCATPVCAPGASPATITSGDLSTLSANCTVPPDAPLTYQWTQGCSTSATCTVSPTKTTSYSVTATSGACSSVPAATTVTVPANLLQGGLSWMSNNIGGATWKNVGTADWTTANGFCNAATFNGQTDWRLPTLDELVQLLGSGALVGSGWVLADTWTNVPGDPTYHHVINLSNGATRQASDTTANYVACVAPLPKDYVMQGGLVWTNNRIGQSTWNREYANWTTGNAFCANGTFLGQTGWRLPTLSELQSLYKSGAFKTHNWALYSSITSTLAYTRGAHYGVHMQVGETFNFWDSEMTWISCVWP